MTPQKIIGIVVLVALLTLGATFTLSLQKNKTGLPKYSSLIVSNQYPGTSVFVSSAVLSEKGVIVVYKEEKGIIGKTIGTSQPLTPGENKNINIKLSEETRDGQILFVALMKGDGQLLTDRKKKDLTQRIVVETSKGTEQKIGATHAVRYTLENGFYPALLIIKAGDTVTFVNESEGSLWVASSPHPTHTDYPEFDQRSSVEEQGTYSFIFTKVGTWNYHNHESSARRGSIIVE